MVTWRIGRVLGYRRPNTVAMVVAGLFVVVTASGCMATESGSSPRNPWHSDLFLAYDPATGEHKTEIQAGPGSFPEWPWVDGAEVFVLLDDDAPSTEVDAVERAVGRVAGAEMIGDLDGEALQAHLERAVSPDARGAMADAPPAAGLQALRVAVADLDAAAAVAEAVDGSSGVREVAYPGCEEIAASSRWLGVEETNRELKRVGCHDLAVLGPEDADQAWAVWFFRHEDGRVCAYHRSLHAGGQSCFGRGAPRDRIAPATWVWTDRDAGEALLTAVVPNGAARVVAVTEDGAATRMGLRRLLDLTVASGLVDHEQVDRLEAHAEDGGLLGDYDYDPDYRFDWPVPAREADEVESDHPLLRPWVPPLLSDETG